MPKPTDSTALTWLGGQDRVVIERWDGDDHGDDPPIWGVQIHENHWYVGETIQEAIEHAMKANKKQEIPAIPIDEPHDFE